MVSASDLSTLSVTVIFAVESMTSVNPLMVARSPLSSVRDVRVILPVVSVLRSSTSVLVTLSETLTTAAPISTWPSGIDLMS